MLLRHVMHSVFRPWWRTPRDRPGELAPCSAPGPPDEDATPVPARLRHRPAPDGPLAGCRPLSPGRAVATTVPGFRSAGHSRRRGPGRTREVQIPTLAPGCAVVVRHCTDRKASWPQPPLRAGCEAGRREWAPGSTRPATAYVPWSVAAEACRVVRAVQRVGDFAGLRGTSGAPGARTDTQAGPAGGGAGRGDRRGHDGLRRLRVQRAWAMPVIRRSPMITARIAFPAIRP